jgi:hypothetical protein
VDWAKTKNGRKVPFDPGTTNCHFETCGKESAQMAQQEAQPRRPADGSSAQELTVAIRALASNAMALDATIKALIARLGNGRDPAHEPAAAKMNGSEVVPNIHGVVVTDEDISF